MTNIKLKDSCAFEKASFALMFKLAENNIQLLDDLLNFFWSCSSCFQLESYLDEVNDQSGNSKSNLILIQEIEIDGYKIAQFKDYFGGLWWTASYEKLDV